MANYVVKFPRSEEVMQKELEERIMEGYPNWTPRSCISCEINIDLFILAVLDCENSGIMIRKTMEALVLPPPWKHRKYKNVEVIVGKMFWASSKKLFSYKLRFLKEIAPTVTFYHELGAAFIKCFKVAERYDIVRAAKRNTDAYRYWCEFKLGERNYEFEHILIKHWYSKTQEEPAKQAASINNVLYMLTLWDDYVSLDLDILNDINTYVRKDYSPSTNVNKVNKALEYLRTLAYFLRKTYSEFEVVDGRVRRITKTFPTELYTPIIAKVQSTFDDVLKISEKLSCLAKAQHTLDTTTLNFHVLHNLCYDMKYLHEMLWSILSTAYDINVNVRREFKKVDKHFLSLFNDDSYSKAMAEDKHTKEVFGYYCHGPRYSRMPRNGEDMRAFIFT